MIYRLVMFIKLVIELFNDEKCVLEWMCESVYGLGGKRLLDMVFIIVDFEIVKDFIGRVEYGVFL